MDFYFLTKNLNPIIFYFFSIKFLPFYFKGVQTWENCRFA